MTFKIIFCNFHIISSLMTLIRVYRQRQEHKTKFLNCENFSRCQEANFRLYLCFWIYTWRLKKQHQQRKKYYNFIYENIKLPWAFWGKASFERDQLLEIFVYILKLACKQFFISIMMELLRLNWKEKCEGLKIIFL